jgi:Holliday junction resolvase
MVTNYQRGATFERRVKKDLEECGYFVVRSAGSKSPVDLVGIKNGMCVLYQCKYGSGVMSKKERERFNKLCRDLYCAGYLAYQDDDGIICFKLLSLGGFPEDG